MDVNLSIIGPGGAISLGSGAGITEGGITIKMIEDKNTMTIAADGTGQHSLHAGKGATIEVEVLKTSPVNQLLRVMYDLQTSSSALHGKNTMTLVQTASGDISTARQVAFKKLPDLKYAKDAGMQTWPFDVIALDGVLGTY